MPITPAHAAAAWPIHRAAKRLPLAALVIGTFSPDLEYVLRLRPVGKFGHTPAGLVVFCVPATLVVLWVWWTLVRPSLTPLLPPGLRAAAEAPLPGRRSDFFPLAIVAALIGAATHIFWDGFTHRYGWGTALFPALRGPVPGLGIDWTSLGQYVSTVVGLIVIAAWIVLAIRRHPPEARRFAPGQLARLLRVVLFVTAAALTVAAVNAAFGSSFLLSLGRAAIGFEIGLALGLVSYALYTRR